jgi:hypothetical protein
MNLHVKERGSQLSNYQPLKEELLHGIRFIALCMKNTHDFLKIRYTRIEQKAHN